MSDLKWVPGFIWVTPFVLHHKDGQIEALPQHLLRIDSIETVVASVYDDRERGNIYLRGWHEPKAVMETPEEIAELIRFEWESRVSRDAEIRWASTTGERR